VVEAISADDAKLDRTIADVTIIISTPDTPASVAKHTINVAPSRMANAGTLNLIASRRTLEE
jgi:hypothetical protein